MWKNLVLMLSLVLCMSLLAQDRWAFIVGVSEYPAWQEKLPALPSCATDAQTLATILTSEYCEFDPEQVLLFTNENASYQNIQKSLVEQLGKTKPEDFVFFVFLGHGVIEYDRMHLLLHNSQPDQLSQTALSLDRLADLLTTYIPAKRLLIALDTRHSSQSLGGSWQTNIGWSLGLSDKELAILNSCAPYQMSQSRSGSGIFSYFMKRTLLGSSYLGKAADANQDGLITVTEFGEYLSNTIRFSGLGQHPIFWGKSDIVLACHIQKPIVKMISPTFLQNRGKAMVGNFILQLAFNRRLTSIQVNGQDGVMGIATERQGIYPFQHYTYQIPFTTKISPEQSSILVVVHDEDSQRWELKVPLVWCSRGWYGEWMPPGMTKASEIGIYRWEPDQSEMVYIPEGPAMLGIPEESQASLLAEVKELYICLKRLQNWQEQDYRFRRTLLQGLQETHDAIRPLVKQLNQIYQKTRLWDQVQRNTSKMPTQQPIPDVPVSPQTMRSDQALDQQASSFYPDTAGNVDAPSPTSAAPQNASGIADDNAAHPNTTASSSISTVPLDPHELLGEQASPQTRAMANMQVDPNALPKFQEMLRQSQQDLGNISQQKQEYQDILDYLDLLIHNDEKIFAEWRPRTIHISGFYIDRYEVTNAQYRRFCTQAARPTPMAPSWNADYLFIDDYPVIAVSWEDAMAYSSWANKKLATAAQWEKAARTPQGFHYPWGNQEPDLMLVNGQVAPPVDVADSQTPRMRPLAVRSLPPGSFGCYHLSGNVHEWCQDLAFLPTMEMPVVGQEHHVTKGGSYASPSLLLSSWFMQPFRADTRRSDLGFRCVVEAEK